jgi:hypothetical protein
MHWTSGIGLRTALARFVASLFVVLTSEVAGVRGEFSRLHLVMTAQAVRRFDRNPGQEMGIIPTLAWGAVFFLARGLTNDKEFYSLRSYV